MKSGTTTDVRGRGKKGRAGKAPGEARPETASVWDVYDPQIGGHCGYLVTEPGELHRVIAYVDVSGGGTDEGLPVARRIAADPSLLDRRGHLVREPLEIFIDDFRHAGTLGGRAIPGYVFGLDCRPAGAGEGYPFRQPRPYCEHLLAEIQEANAGRVLIAVGDVTRLRHVRGENVADVARAKKSGQSDSTHAPLVGAGKSVGAKGLIGRLV